MKQSGAKLCFPALTKKLILFKFSLYSYTEGPALNSRWVSERCLKGVPSPINRHAFYRQARRLLGSSIISFLLLILLQGALSHAAVTEPCVPNEYGTVICRYNEKSPTQLYIIGIGHRDTLAGSNAPLTSRIQAEVYKIAEWLVQNQGVELLLPEGFFDQRPRKTLERQVRAVSVPAPPGEMSIEILERTFSGDLASVNAEMLLKENFSLLVEQVEDIDLYQTVYENIRLLVESRGNMERSFLIRSELDYHQKRRVGAMLQKIPEIVNEEFREGRIDNKKAIFTIGLSHISNIIDCLEKGKITVRSPLFTQAKYEDYIHELNLTIEDFGISVIVPRALINDHEALGKSGPKVF